mgnify:CR=1 FL=1
MDFPLWIHSNLYLYGDIVLDVPARKGQRKMNTTMTIDEMIKMLEKVRTKAGRGDVPVYFADDSEISAANLIFRYENDAEEITISLY